MRIIHHIRRQPLHIRELATLGCTIFVVAIVASIWFHSFRQDMYALLNPNDQTESQDQYFVKESKSLFGSVFQTFDSGLSEILNLFKDENDSEVVPAPTNTPAAYPLPVSGSR